MTQRDKNDAQGLEESDVFMPNYSHLLRTTHGERGGGPDNRPKSKKKIIKRESKKGILSCSKRHTCKRKAILCLNLNLLI